MNLSLLLDYINAKIEYEFAVREPEADGYMGAAIEEREKLKEAERKLRESL